MHGTQLTVPERPPRRNSSHARREAFGSRGVNGPEDSPRSDNARVRAIKRVENELARGWLIAG